MASAPVGYTAADASLHLHEGFLHLYWQLKQAHYASTAAITTQVTAANTRDAAERVAEFFPVLTAVGEMALELVGVALVIEDAKLLVVGTRSQAAIVVAVEHTLRLSFLHNKDRSYSVLIVFKVDCELRCNCQCQFEEAVRLHD